MTRWHLFTAALWLLGPLYTITCRCADGLRAMTRWGTR